MRNAEAAVCACTRFKGTNAGGATEVPCACMGRRRVSVNVVAAVQFAGTNVSGIGASSVKHSVCDRKRSVQ